MKTKSFYSVLLTLSYLMVATVLCAQDYRGRVQGTIMDGTQAVVPGASVSLVNTKTGVSTRRSANATGHYIFDYVEPGDYELDVQSSGFAKFVQKNITVRARGDVTVDAILKLGAADQRVEVEAAPVAVEFNTSTMSTTIDQRMTTDLPALSRNPFSLTMLDPAVITTASTGAQPYNSWASSSIQVGGGSSYTNNTSDIMVDSTPVGLGAKTSYTPPMDAVQQVVVLENSMDASNGNSAGGIMQVVMKSGTNDWHGNVWYTGRYPFMQALYDRSTKSKSTTRQNMFGGSLGNPVIKNKLFNYFVYEQWRMSNPATIVGTVPTAAQRTGDFSHSYNANGTLQTIYDPMTSTFNAGTGLGSRTAFLNNIIPADRIDSVAKKIMADIPQPNNPGDNLTGANNFKSTYSAQTTYYNFSDRVDYQVSNKWRVYARVDRFHTIVSDTNPMNSPAFVSPDGSARNAFTTSGDAIYTINPTTMLNIHGDYNSFVDGYQADRTASYSDFWSNPWYSTFKVDAPTLYPRMEINGTNFGSPWVYWYDNPHGESFNATLSKQYNKHYVKIGFDHRRQVNSSISYSQNAFKFSPSMTANDFVSPDKLTGNAYASFLLGAMDNTSAAYTSPHKQARWRSYAGYVNDDYKPTKRLTLNLGLRWEYEAPLTDPHNGLGRYLDLTQPNPTLQAAPPQLPAAVTQYRTAAPIYNGVYNFATSSHPGMYNAPKAVFMPRFGFAFKIDDKTAFRFGYGRFIMPFAKSNYNNSLGVAYPGLDASQNTLSPVLGVPQVLLSDPFPSTSPLAAPIGSAYGANYGLGNSLTWYKQDFTPGVNDRFNFSLQRQLPARIVLDATLLMNFGRNMPLRRDFNLADPNLTYTYKGALSTQVANPFYQYGTPLTFPGTLRNQKTVSIGSLLTPYPQYGSLYYNDSIGGDHYRALELKATRPFANGFNFMVGYNYNHEETLQYFNSIDQYANHLTWREGTTPRHRLSGAGIYEIPIGRGRKLLPNASRLLDAAIGGWQLSSVFSYRSGNFLTVGQYEMDGNPAISNPTAKRWFDTSKFHKATPYTPRTNPYTYAGLVGPVFWNIDMSISKDFTVTEKVKSQLKMSTYNATNTFMRADPDMNYNNSTFGQALRQSSFQQGRQTEIALKLFF